MKVLNIEKKSDNFDVPTKTSTTQIKEELRNIDCLWSSNYVRAISTAKYISYKNNIDINIDSRLNERKIGDLEEFEKLGKGKNITFTDEQLINKKFKNVDVECNDEVIKRMNEFF